MNERREVAGISKPMRPELESLLAMAKVQFEAMTGKEIQAMLSVQRESWTRGEMQLDRMPDDLAVKTMSDILNEQAKVRRIKPAPREIELRLREELQSAASLFEALSDGLPEDDVNGVMMRVMAQRNRGVLSNEGNT